MARTRINAATDLAVGDVIRFTCNGAGRGGHYGVTATVTNVNRSTVKAEDNNGSYRPGKRWTISVNEFNPVFKQILDEAQ